MANSADPDQTALFGKQCRPWSDCSFLANSPDPDQTAPFWQTVQILIRLLLFGKQCRPWWDCSFLVNSVDPDQTVPEGAVCSESALFAQTCLSEYLGSLGYFCIWALNIWAASWQNQQNDLYAQWRLRSAWASTQSDYSLRHPHEETLGPQLSIECTVKTLIRLGRCPGWSESSLVAHVILLVLSCSGSFCIITSSCLSIPGLQDKSVYRQNWCVNKTISLSETWKLSEIYQA